MNGANVIADNESAFSAGHLDTNTSLLITNTGLITDINTEYRRYAAAAALSPQRSSRTASHARCARTPSAAGVYSCFRQRQLMQRSRQRSRSCISSVPSRFFVTEGACFHFRQRCNVCLQLFLSAPAPPTAFLHDIVIDRDCRQILIDRLETD